jgi:glycosyltransferase involved in cell wall biosynthesis
LNEAETLETCIRKAQGFLETNQIQGEILVSDNGSQDGSQDIARRCGARVVDAPKRGYGAAMIHGSFAARGKYIIMGDSDDSYDFSNLMPFLQKLRAGHDLVMGNRLAGGIKPGAMPWMNRWVGTPVLSALGRLFFHCPVADFNCGLRGYSAEAFREMDLRAIGMEFASEMIVKATLLKMQIAEVPTTLSPDGRSRSPHLRPWRDGWRHLRFMLLYSPRWLFLYPGCLLMALGLIVAVLLLPHPRALGRVTFDIHTLFFAAMAVLVGFQAILFAVFSKTFAITERLLPRDPKMDRLLHYLQLESGLLVGLALIAYGIGGAIYGVKAWEIHGFGPLLPTRVMRIIIPAGTSLVLGCEVILSSFFLSVLGMGRK